MLITHAFETSSTNSTADRLRMLVSHARVDAAGQVLAVTVSVGATGILPDDDVEKVVQRADQLMYQSKSGGKNHVSCG